MAATRYLSPLVAVAEASRQRYAAYVIRRADARRDRGDFARAAGLYLRAVALDPRRPEIRVQLGHMLKELSRFQEAEAAYRQALAMASDDADSHLQLGHLMKLLGRLDEAIAAYRSAQLLDPEDGAAAAELAVLGVCPSDEPEQAERFKLQARIRNADRLRDAHKPEEAAEAYKVVLETSPDLIDIRIQYGNMLKDAGRVAEAETAYRTALAQRPDLAEINLQLGHALKLQGKRDDALAAYRRAAALQPSLEAAWTELLGFNSVQQRDALESRLARGGVEALLGVADEVDRLVRGVARLNEVLPSLCAQIGFPLSAYDRFRRIYDVPPPPETSPTPRIAILLSATGCELEALQLIIASVVAQNYQAWQLYVIGSDVRHRAIVERAGAGDGRLTWVSKTHDHPVPVAECRSALKLSADWFLFLAPDYGLHPHALGWFAAVAGQVQAHAFVMDEETLTYSATSTPTRCEPHLRQAVDFDTLLEHNPYGDTVLVEAGAYRKVAADLSLDALITARHSLLLQLAATGTVGHLPLPLVARLVATGDSNGDTSARRGDWRKQVIHPVLDVTRPSGNGQQRGLEVISQEDRHATITVIVPTRDNAGDVMDLVESLRRSADRVDSHNVIILDNGSRRPETLAILESLGNAPDIEVVRMDEPFNWSRLNNRAAAMSRADLLVFANDDTLMLSKGWDRQLRLLLGRGEVGAVGARLLYPDGSLQHGGIILGSIDIDAHDGRHEPGASAGPCHRWQVTRAVSAVTGAFLAVRRELFETAGGFDEINLTVAYSDIDFALKLRALGHKILWTPHITLRHFESKSRGLDHLDREKSARLQAERMFMRQRWGNALDTDPTVNPTWHSAETPFKLISAPSDARLWRHIQLCAAANPWLPAPAIDFTDTRVRAAE
ncbi:MAG: tetratricopeptide repeat protein [Alphaproteobacteria bacterium]|nr:tetratricopeptide repeat protein [Alphaproteobacteria bacterium]